METDRLMMRKLAQNEVVAFTTLSNKKSQAVMHKIGMKDSGNNFNHPLLPRNSRLECHVLYKINKVDWQLYNKYS